MKWNKIRSGVVLFGLALAIVFGLRGWKRSAPSADRVSVAPESENATSTTVGLVPTTAPASPDGSTSSLAGKKSLLLPTSVTWDRDIEIAEFSRFADWVSRYRASKGESEKAVMEPEGIALAEARRDALWDLIQTDPRRALELTVPFGMRQALPQSVETLLEERISTRADVMVIGVTPLPGRERETAPLTRSITLKNHTYDTYAVGWWTNHNISTYNAPIQAIGLSDGDGGGVLALSSDPVRLPDDPEEAAALESQALDPICSISGNLAASRGQSTIVNVAGEALFTCGLDHAIVLDEQLIAAAEGANGPAIIGGNPLAGYDGYTTGRKRFLLMRPGFSDLTNTMSDAQVPGHFNSFSNFMYEMSYGKLIFAGLAQGSDATPIMKLPGIASDYDNTGLGKLYNTCKDVARTNYGFDLSQYDFFYVVTGSQPAAGYAGLGFVRGVGFHLANGYYSAGTASHEYGHNLGLNHANFWSTLARTIIGPGNSIEYGDGNDPMGGAGTSPQHYNSRYKNYLTWISNSDVVTISSANSGTFRLYSHDIAETPGGLKGLRIVRNASQNYWIHFRQRFSGKAMQNGVQLLWTGNGNQSSLLLDTRLADGSGDNALVIGRTFSDTAGGVHITPIGKGHTSPESMDVVVNIGTFAANRAPSAVVSASATTVGTGTTISFNAVATDPDGDTLAYYWDFGDGDYSIDNSATATHNFATAGEYRVQCVVSDMKGGTSRDSVVIRVGNPASFRISGRVLKLDQKPYVGIKVSADSTHAAVTDGDGTYAITALAAGPYTLSAIEPVSGQPTFIHPFFSNPVTVGPSAINMDWIVGTGAPPVTLVATGSVWKYLDNGSDQGTGWTAPGFNDSTWSSGPAQLGYGEGDEARVISFGPNANSKYITYYFRRAFTVTDPTLITNLTVSLLRDDGGIVYLNGVEIFRSNMPAGAVTYATLASAAIDDQVFFSSPVPSGMLVAGNNVLAVEIHQADITSSDISFDLRLDAENLGVVPKGTFVYLASPEANSVFTAPTNLTLNAIAVTSITSFTNVEFFDGATKLGEDPTAPYSFDWSGVSAGNHSLTIRARQTNGQAIISAPVNISVVNPSVGAPPVALSLIQTGSFWKFFAAAVSPPGAWANPSFDDTTWSGGMAQLGYGEADEATTIPYGGNVNSKWITSYYRHFFTINDPGAVTNLTLHLKRDDGAVVYLNGAEILRDNVGPGPVTWGTLATNATDDGQVFLDFALNPATLAPGTNLVAVEIHQTAINSSDISFDLGLDALASTNRGRGVYIASPSDGLSTVAPESAVISAQVVVGDLLGVTNVEFFADGLKLGHLQSPPYSFPWSNPSVGVHQIVVVATDTAGNSVTSAPANILFSSPPLSTELVSLGEDWKYLDDGTDPGTAWRGRLFDDSAWDEGAARLGYGGDGEITTVSFGDDPNNKNITTYFRRSFNVANPAAFTSAKLRLIRDDGAVVYLNGVEVFRSNMAAGLISANSLALTTVNASEETAFFDAILTPGTLLSGTNVVAVELHQASPASSDLGFDLALFGVTSTNLTDGIYLASPANGAVFEAPPTISLSVVAVVGTGVVKVEFFDGQTKLGESTTTPFSFTWTNPPAGPHALTARATDSTAQTMTSPPVNITVTPPALPSASVENLLLPSRSTWTYLDVGSNQGSDWTKPGFSAVGWKTGVARFGYGLDGEFTKISNNVTTHYFRKWFNVTNPAILTELLFRLQRDDGAVVHLNGQEIYRSNMPTGTVNSATLASTVAANLDENYVFETFVPTIGSGLLIGSNLVAVELHQASDATSDAGFDLEIWGVGTTEPRLYLSNPFNGASVYLPVVIDAQAWAGTGRSISKVEFFQSTNKVGEKASAPFSFAWSTAPLGTNRISAVATDNEGHLIPSEIVTVTVGLTAVSTTLVATQSVWRYLDDGSNQGTNWSQRTYDDSAWAQGPAELGYGNLPVTIVSFGGDPLNRYMTTYFRRWFVVPPDGAYTNFNFGLKRDDGAVVYLNGRELFRSNMPTGVITNLTPAIASVGSTDEETFFPTSLRATNLVSGTNLLAVEVHQNAPGSGDLGFDIEFVGIGYAISATPPSLAIERVGPSVNVSWPLTALPWNIYSSGDLSPEGWVAAGTPAAINGFNTLTLSPTNQTRFYQLRRP